MAGNDNGTASELLPSLPSSVPGMSDEVELHEQIKRMALSEISKQIASLQQTDEFLRRASVSQMTAVTTLTGEISRNRELFRLLSDRLENLEKVLSGVFGRHDNAEAALAGLADRLDGTEVTLSSLATRINHIEQAVADFMRAQEQSIAEIRAEYRRELDHEAKRVDYALGEIEGFGPEREAFIKARHTAEYQAAFEEKDPLVSVCVSTYNRSSLLIERCLGSLRAQTYPNLEIIVVGDHCTDDTEERIRALGDPRVRYYNLPDPPVYPEPGIDRWRVAGTYPANFGRKQARGAFISHLDDDDTSEPDRIASLVEAAQKHRADFVWHQSWQETPEGTWRLFGNGEFKLAQINLSMCLYHRYFVRLDADVFAYRVDEPGDWNALRHMAHLRPRLHFIARPLTRYFLFPKRPPFVPRADETYLE